jgi:hypothetical protein
MANIIQLLRIHNAIRLARHARHSVMENIRAAKEFRENPELLHEKSSEYLYTHDSLDLSDKRILSLEVGDGCFKVPSRLWK